MTWSELRFLHRKSHREFLPTCSKDCQGSDETRRPSRQREASYSWRVGSIMYVMIETRPDIAISISLCSRFTRRCQHVAMLLRRMCGICKMNGLWLRQVVDYKPCRTGQFGVEWPELSASYRDNCAKIMIDGNDMEEESIEGQWIAHSSGLEHRTKKEKERVWKRTCFYRW